VRSQTQDQRGTRRIYGIVNATANVLSGVGFLATKTGPGAYTVRFTEPFKNAPTVVATTNSNLNYSLVVGALLPDSFTVNVFVASTAAAADVAFDFTAEGLAR
jgi:hypothetical protein